MNAPGTGEGVHPTAVVEAGARIGAGVRVGPYSIVGADAVLGEGVVLHAHVVVGGRTEIGAGTEIYPFASIGLPPQDLKYKGEPSRLVVGRNNVIREYVTMNPGTAAGGMVTRVGDNCLFMASAHVAHDCRVGDGAIFANNASISGHVTVGERAILGGLCAVHQYTRIGAHAIIGAMTGVDRDVLPYAAVRGERGRVVGVNIVGMRRRGVPRAGIDAVRRAFDALFGPDGTLRDRLDALAREGADDPLVMELVEFVRADSSRAICPPAGAPDRRDA